MKSCLTILGIAIAFVFSAHLSMGQCEADFDTTSAGLTVNFINQSTGNYQYINYDFGDGNGSENVANPTHTYADSGMYAVCLFVMDTVNFTCWDEYCDTLTFGSQTCKADFESYTDQLDVLVYNASFGSSDSIWISFGDGGAGSSDTAAEHTYDSAGLYTICLWAYDSGLVCDSFCTEVYVTDEDCDADFTYADDGLDVDFEDASSGPYNAVFWDFGDGSWSEAFDPSHSYSSAGTYEVCLYVYDTVWGTCEDEYCEFITVSSSGGGGGCEADFEVAVDQLSVSCENLSSGGLINSWDFGDESGIVFDENPEHTYEEPGTYEICLTILNPFPFCTDQHCTTVTVTEFTCEPTFSYSFNEQNGFAFQNTTTVGDFTSVKWTFGDGNTSTFNNPTYFYNAAGVYEVCLITYDGDNVCGETCSEIEVYPLGIQSDASTTIQLFPSPNDGRFFLQLSPRHTSGIAVVRDMMGSICYQQSISSEEALVEFNLQSSAGVYVMELWSEGHCFARSSFVIQ